MLVDWGTMLTAAVRGWYGGGEEESGASICVAEVESRSGRVGLKLARQTDEMTAMESRSMGGEMSAEGRDSEGGWKKFRNTM